jgi:hypothetical protein
VAVEDPQCSVRRPFMLVVNQTLGLKALGGLISQPLLDHGITNFRAVGGKSVCVGRASRVCMHLYACMYACMYM